MGDQVARLVQGAVQPGIVAGLANPINFGGLVAGMLGSGAVLTIADELLRELASGFVKWIQSGATPEEIEKMIALIEGREEAIFNDIKTTFRSIWNWFKANPIFGSAHQGQTIFTRETLCCPMWNRRRFRNRPMWRRSYRRSTRSHRDVYRN